MNDLRHCCGLDPMLDAEITETRPRGCWKEAVEGHEEWVLDLTEGQEDKEEFASWRAVMERVLKLG